MLTAEEILEAFVKYAPSAEEMRKVCDYKGDARRLGPVEHFYRYRVGWGADDDNGSDFSWMV